MSETKHLDRRDSRDRLVDLLGLGETYPLRDVVVSDELKVPYGRAVKLTAVPGQRGVRYELRDDEGDGPPGDREGPLTRLAGGQAVPVAADGDGGPLELTTPAIVEDVTYTLHAAKRHPRDDGTTSVRAVLLRQAVHIKVGLDVELAARVRFADRVEPLVAGRVADGEPRISDYGGAVIVEVDGAQEGVDYDLVSVDGDVWTPRSAGDVRGKGEGVTISIASTPLLEDTVLRVRATKKFTVAEARETEVELLRASLPLALRADPGRAVAAAGPSVVDHGADAKIRVAATQTSAEYQLFARPIQDAEFIAPSGVGDQDHHDAAVVRPPWSRVWTDLEGFTAIGEPTPGTGGPLDLPLPARTADTMVLVRATKSHAATTPVLSAVQLQQEVVVLVRPDPAPGLELRVTMIAGATTGPIEVLGGQPGVYYFLRAAADGPDLGRPAYVHQRDPADPQENKGVGQLKLEIDLAVASDGDAATSSAPPSHRRAAPPVVEAAPLPAGATLHVRAVRGQSRIAAPLARTAELTPVPEIRHEPIGVDRGHPVEVHVRPGDPGDRYRLVLAGATVGEVLGGEGQELVLVGDPAVRDEVFTVEVSPRVDRGLPVHRVVPVDVPLRPAAGLPARILDGEPLGEVARLVDHAAPVRVAVDASEADVVYRLVALVGDEEQPRSVADVPGDGGTIELKLARTDEDVDLRVRAVRRFFAGAPEAAQPQLLLDAVLPLKVRADPTLAVGVDPAPISPYAAPAGVVVAASQTSARYELHARPVVDADRRRGDPTPGELAVPVPDAPDARVVRPPAASRWVDIDGLVPVGQPLPGTGGDLVLPLTPALARDHVAVVKARKDHDPEHASAVQLAAAALVLVAPDPRPSLRLVVPVSGDMSLGTVEFVGGEPGVFYTLLDPQGAPLAPPAYVPRRDPADPSRNRGVALVRLGVDLVVARAGGAAAEADRATTAPAPAQVETGPRPLGEAWRVRATRVDTRVACELAGAATPWPLPALAVAPAQVSPGVAAAVRVVAAAVGERYWLTRDGAPVGEAVDGAGVDVLLPVGALTATTSVTVHALRTDPSGIAVERRASVEVLVGT
jgi:hypothetical protein